MSDKAGRRIGGTSIPKKCHEWITINEGETKHIVGLKGVLWPGVYFIGAGLSGDNEEGGFIHRVSEAEIIRVVDNKASVKVGDMNLGID